MAFRAVWVLFFVGWLPAVAAGQEWAQKMFETTSHDFGQVARYAKAEYAFILKNRYLPDVHVSDVRSSCGCTIPRIVNPDLKTYEKGAVVAELNTRAFEGQRSATLTVTIDKPQPATVQLHIRADIRGEVRLEPASVNFGTIAQGTPAEQQIAASCAGYGGWRVLEVASGNPRLSGEIVSAERRGGQIVYQIKVCLAADAPVGYVHDHLLLKTNDPRFDAVPVLVEGRVVPPVVVSPGALFLGVLQPGQEVTRPLVVRGSRPFRVLGVGCEGEVFRIRVAGGDAAKPLHVIPLTFTANDHTGKVVGRIRIQTDLDGAAAELLAHAVVSR